MLWQVQGSYYVIIPHPFYEVGVCIRLSEASKVVIAYIQLKCFSRTFLTTPTIEAMGSAIASVISPEVT